MVPNKISEKRKPHYDLDELKELVRQEAWIVTRVADKGAMNLGLSRYELKKIVLALRSQDFYKSMTSYRDHKLWQDVYKPRISIQEECIELYIKLQKSLNDKCAEELGFAAVAAGIFVRSSYRAGELLKNTQGKYTTIHHEGTKSTKF